MNDRQLECFLVLAEEKNFSRVAERLYITQPAITHQIKALETELGLSLFERTTKQVRLTEAGKELLPIIREIDRNNRILRSESTRLADRKEKQLTIGVPSIMMTYDRSRYISIMECVKKEYPDHAIQFKIIPGADKMYAVLSKSVDLQMSGSFSMCAPELGQKTLFQSWILVGMGRENPLSGKERIELEDLKDQTVFLDARDDTFAPMVQKTLPMKKYRIKVHAIDSLDFAILPISTENKLVFTSTIFTKDQEIMYRPLNVPPIEIVLAWRKEEETERLLNLIDRICEIYRNVESEWKSTDL